MSTWWVNLNELDDDQRNVISLPIDESAIITGPPGSGKTNLLLLRANYLYMAGFRNIIVVTFTRSLREFIASGANQYEFPNSKIMTCREWQIDFLRQYGSRINQSGDFETDRNVYSEAISKLINNLKLSNLYDAILLDEAQDYSSSEIETFSKLTNRLFCVADERQKIYDGDDSITAIRKCVSSTRELKYHYRNGYNICRVADEIAKKWQNYRPLTETSNYNEQDNPSTVDNIECSSLSKQMEQVIFRLRVQRLAFPDELIGILCPKKETLNYIWDSINASEHSGFAFLLHGSDGETFPEGRTIIVSTFHAAKGLEFRALHLVGCDDLKMFPNNRRLVFTGVTRAKTSLTIYHCGNLHGYFESALNSLHKTITLPKLSEIFGGSR